MIKYYSASEYDRGFLLELKSSGSIINAKALLVTPDNEVCIDIFSIPFNDEYRLIAVPDWNLSFIHDPSDTYDHHSFLHDRKHMLCFSNIFTVTISIIHCLIDSLPSNISDDNLAGENDILESDYLLDFPPVDLLNQQLPF